MYSYPYYAKSNKSKAICVVHKCKTKASCPTSIFGNQNQTSGRFWCYVYEREALWRAVADVKYGSAWCGWCFNEVNWSYEMGIWKNIMTGWGEFYSHTRFDFGMVWYGDQALKAAFPFPNMFSLAQCKDASMANHLVLLSDFQRWNVNFLRVTHDWEVDLFTSFFNLLYSFRLRQGGKNKLCWVLSKRELFDVRTYYNVLIPHDNIPFPWMSFGRIRLL
jgi:hypothetical protein